MGDKGSAKVGTSTNTIRSAVVVGGCKFHKQPDDLQQRELFAGLGGRVRVDPESTTAADSRPSHGLRQGELVVPRRAASGSQPFDNNTTRNSSKGTVALLGLAKFDCTAKNTSGSTVGRLAWDPASHSLTASGTIFIDGNLDIGSNRARALHRRHLGDDLRQRDGLVPQRRLDLRPRPRKHGRRPLPRQVGPQTGRAADLGPQHRRTRRPTRSPRRPASPRSATRPSKAARL